MYIVHMNQVKYQKKKKEKRTSWALISYYWLRLIWNLLAEYVLISLQFLYVNYGFAVLWDL